MLPKKNRLVTDFDFRRVRKYGRAYHSPYFSLYLIKEKESQPSRFGFVVSTRVSKSAVKRNFLKRILRAPVEEQIGKIAPGLSGALWVKGQSLSAPPQALREEVFTALKRTGAVREE